MIKQMREMSPVSDNREWWGLGLIGASVFLLEAYKLQIKCCVGKEKEHL